MRIEANGLSFEVDVRGQGPAVLLLHGFPDSSHLWRHQVPALVAAGHRVIAPDLRGFGRSDRPEGVEHYRLTDVVGDLLGILGALGEERVSVVGHDWGAAVAWTLAMFAPDRVERLVAVSVGYPGGYHARGGMAQREVSWYMLFFLHEGVAEEALAADGFALFREWTRGQGDVDRHVADLSRPGALTAALSWYRANIPAAAFGARDGGPALPRVACPTLGIWSDGDDHCLEPQMKGSEAFVDGPWRYERIDGASHWVPLDAPDRLNELLVEFLAP